MTATKLMLILTACLLMGCEFKCDVGNKSQGGTTTKTISSKDAGGLTGAVIKNDIELDVTDIKVSNAYLANEANQPLDRNVVAPKEKITCFIHVDTGWTKIGGQSFIGATEKVIGSDGTVLLDTKDLFADYDSLGILATDAKYIQLRASVTKKMEGIDTYTVQFKVWDKKGPGLITGRYKFKVQ